MFGLSLVVTVPAQAQWVNDSYVKDSPNCHIHSESGGGNSGNGTNSISSTAIGSGPPYLSCWNYQTSALIQRFHWSGSGSGTTFVAQGNGWLDGHVNNLTGNGLGTATSKAMLPGAVTSVWTYPEGAKNPRGGIQITPDVSGRSASYSWSLYTEAKGFYGSLGGRPIPASYNCLAQADYTIN